MNEMVERSGPYFIGIDVAVSETVVVGRIHPDGRFEIIEVAERIHPLDSDIVDPEPPKPE